MAKVLIVEDAQSDKEKLEKIVLSFGAQVLLASEGAQAVALAQAHSPALIFMDVNMTGMDGFQATREILSLKECSNSAIVFVTAKNQRADEVWAKMLGGKGFISKPYTEEQIVNELKKYIQN